MGRRTREGREELDGARPAGSDPTFLLIGAQKSGTTSLIHYLGAHPDVFALPDEAHFFDRSYERGTEWYRGLFTGAGAAVAVGESTPEYLYDEQVPPRVAADFPGLRLIAILRDPVSRAYSHYWHNRTRGHEPLSFVDAVEAEPERRLAGDNARMAYSYLDRGRYLRQLEAWCEHYPRDAVRVVLFEDLQRDRVAVTRSLYEFLGADSSVAPAEFERTRNPFVTFRSQRLRGPIRRLPGPLRRVAGRLNVKKTTYPPLPSDTRTRLAARFAEDNAALASSWGLDLSAWDHA